MNFEQLVHTILIENSNGNAERIPANDGKREVYGYTHTSDYYFERWSEHAIERYWDAPTTQPSGVEISIFNNQQDFVNFVKSEYTNPYDDVRRALQYLTESITPDMTGEYRVFIDVDFSIDEGGFGFWFGYEPDRGLQIRKDLEGVDSSGFEDLL